MKTFRRTNSDILFYFVSFLIVIACVLPVIWIFLTAFKRTPDIFSIPPKWIFTPTFANFVEIFAHRNFLRYLINSSLLSIFSTLLSLLIGMPAAYGLSRYHFKRKKDLIFWVLSLRMSPAIMAVIPLFIIIARLGLLDKLPTLVIVYLLINTPFVIWMLKGFIDEIPLELDEAARIDGCSELTIMTRIMLPLIRPGVSATSVLCIIFSWNEFVFALILTGTNARTLPVTITQFITLTGISWGPMCAAGTITILPIFIFTLLVQKHLVRGLTLGAIK